MSKGEMTGVLLSPKAFEEYMIDKAIQDSKWEYLISWEQAKAELVAEGKFCAYPPNMCG